jgi:hypothetical protein
MSSPLTLKKDFDVILDCELRRHFKFELAKQDEIEVDPESKQVRYKDGGPAFVTVSVENVPVKDNSFTSHVRKTMELMSKQLALSISQSGFGEELVTLDGPRTMVDKRVGVAGFLLTVFISLKDVNGLVKNKPVEPAAAPE